ncbi:hypothetical protein [Phaffia rhodozyma]|uniref:Uncharacterized protein n=1 Tax=Phaffia rhodozyma TaxID=264483 RepID=A0A0F7SJ98_PHARH|nr:hypothetical protein [Phaffia rhodozyma]
MSVLKMYHISDDLSTRITQVQGDRFKRRRPGESSEERAQDTSTETNSSSELLLPVRSRSRMTTFSSPGKASLGSMTILRSSSSDQRMRDTSVTELDKEGR